MCNLHVVGIEPQIFVWEDGRRTIQWFYQRGCIGCKYFTKIGQLCWCALGRPAAEIR